MFKDVNRERKRGREHEIVREREHEIGRERGREFKDMIRERKREIT